MKKISLVLLLLLAMLPAVAADFMKGSFHFRVLSENTVAVAGYESSDVDGDVVNIPMMAPRKNVSNAGYSVEIPANVSYNNHEYTVTSIASNAFLNLYRMAEVHIPATVTSIGEAAFAGCNGLAAIYCLDTDTPPTLAASAFASVNLSAITLFVSKGSEEAFATSAWSCFSNVAVSNQVWIKPELTTSDPVSGERYYIANVEAAKFMKGMSTIYSWSTTCGLDSEGLLVKLTETETGWTIQRTADNKYTFRSGADECHVDMGSQGHNNFDFTKLESGYYTIANNADDDVYGVNNTGITTYWNYQPNATVPNHIYCNATAGSEGTFIEWAFISENDYIAYFLALEKYSIGSTLEKAIANALNKYPELDLTDEKAVCNNPASTVEQLNAALVSVKNKVKAADAAFAEANATPESPIDLTSFIVNPSFDDNVNGWTGDPTLGSGAAEFFNKNYVLAQGITNAPMGVYALKVNGFYRAGLAGDAYNNYNAGNINLNAMLYADNSSDLFQKPLMSVMEGIEAGERLFEDGNYIIVGDESFYPVPDNMVTASAYFQAGRYADNCLFFGTQNDYLTIGLKKDVTIYRDWTMFDNFSLMYYGNSEASYNFWAQQLTADTPADAYDNVAMVTGSYVEDYKNAINSNNSASTYSEVMEKIALINAAKDTIEVNMDLWKELYEQTLASTYTATDEDNYNIKCDEMIELGDFLDGSVNDAIDELELTNDELREMIAELIKLTNIATENALKVGSEIVLVNPDFSEGWTGWTHRADASGSVSANTSAHCAESWNNGDFDIYQVIENAPIGAYSIQLQGFYREGRGVNAWNLYFNRNGVMREDVPISTAHIYMNEVKTPLKNVFEYQIPYGDLYYGYNNNLAPYVDPLYQYWYPNDMTAAGQAFDEGAYITMAKGIVAQKGDKMQVGVKGRTNNLNDSWAIFTRFRLVYLGYDPEVIEPILDEEVSVVQNAQLYGSELNGRVEELLQEVATAKETQDGKTMLKIIADVASLNDAIDASAEVFMQLKSMNEALYDALSVSTASSDVKNEATSLYLAIEEALENKTLTTEEASEKIDDIRLMIAKLAIPDDIENASDEAPVDLTSLIMNPGFEKNGDNTTEGWQNTTGYNYGNNNTQKSALCIEFYEKDFNIYQDLAYLPAGTYTVGVSAFFRSTEESSAVLYAIQQNGDSVAVALIQRDSQPSMYPFTGNDQELIDGNGKIIGYVPNDMVSARTYFDAGFYANELIVRTSEAGPLRIGISAKDHNSRDWCIMDDFTLTYYGTNSNRKETLETIRLNEAGFATFSAAIDMTVKTPDVEAYKAAVNDSEIVLTKLNGFIPAGTGVVLYGENTNQLHVALCEAIGDAATNLEDNHLYATTTVSEPVVEMPNEGYIFVLGKSNKFQPYSGASFAAKRAFLHLDYNPIANDAASLHIVFADEENMTTGIETLKSNENKNAYDLSGRPTNAKGMVIKEGRIVFIR